MECKKCTLAVSSERPYVICNGRCSQKVYHIDCVGLREEHMNSISLSRKIIWLCQECMVGFTAWKEEPKHLLETPSDHSHSVDADIAELKVKMDTVMTMLSTFTVPPASPVPPSSSDFSSTAARHSTPVSSSDLISGTKPPCDRSYSAHLPARVCEPITVDEEHNFALLLTNIDGTVTEGAVQQMVCQCLGVSSIADCKNVKKLVPRGMDCSTLDYASFKVVLSEKWSPVAMNSATWPTEIKFREFVRRYKTWKPVT